VNFDTSEEQELLQETIAQFLENECPATRVREIFDGEASHDPALWKGLMELGLGGLVVPEAYGGAGLELIDLALATETLAYGGAPGPFLAHSLAALAIATGGSEAQREKWLPRLATGEAIGTVSLAEGAGVWLPEDWTLALGDTLTAERPFVLGADVADVFVVGTRGGRLALVEAGEGVSVEPYAGADRARRMGTLVLDGAPVQALPGEGAAERLRDAACVLLAADAFGTASRLVDMSVEYAKNREQFGVTIGHFQALKHQLADMAIDIEPARGLYWYAAHAFDHVPDDAERYAALAKSHITERASASPGSATSRSGSSARCSIATCWAGRTSTASAPRSWRAGSRGRALRVARVRLGGLRASEERPGHLAHEIACDHRPQHQGQRIRDHRGRRRQVGAAPRAQRVGGVQVERDVRRHQADEADGETPESSPERQPRREQHQHEERDEVDEAHAPGAHGHAEAECLVDGGRRRLEDRRVGGQAPLDPPPGERERKGDEAKQEPDRLHRVPPG
jgi:alkylation response protein AidB-like acyl-CoA dehydrogenase